MAQPRIPATVITGFLGSGKTTLIRNIITQANGKRLALIVNEFGDIGMDGAMLEDCGAESCSADDIIELANGCICCTVADDFLPSMQQLLAQEPRPDHIIIETSGLALPQPLVQAFNWPDIRNQVMLDGVVTLVDGPALADGGVAHDLAALEAQRAADEELDHESPIDELFADQIGAANLIILSKADLLDEEAAARARATVEAQLEAPTPIIPVSAAPRRWTPFLDSTWKTRRMPVRRKCIITMTIITMRMITITTIITITGMTNSHRMSSRLVTSKTPRPFRS